jgi:hypothetical protein
VEPPLWKIPGSATEFVLSLIEFGFLILEKKFLKIFNVFYSLLPNLGEGQSLLFEQILIPST